MIMYPGYAGLPTASASGTLEAVAAATCTFWALGLTPPTNTAEPTDQATTGRHGLVKWDYSTSSYSTFTLVVGSPRKLWIIARASDDVLRVSSFGDNSFLYGFSAHHYAVTLSYADGSAVLYVDGEPSRTTTVDGLTGVTNGGTGGIYVNSSHGTLATALFGGMEDARFYGRLLSADEIRAIYLLRGADKIVSGTQFKLIHNESMHAANVRDSCMYSSYLTTSTTVPWISGPTVGRARRRR